MDNEPTQPGNHEDLKKYMKNRFIHKQQDYS